MVIKIQPDRKLEREPNLSSRSPLESQKNVVQIHKSIQIIKFIKHILNKKKKKKKKKKKNNNNNNSNKKQPRIRRRRTRRRNDQEAKVEKEATATMAKKQC